MLKAIRGLYFTALLKIPSSYRRNPNLPSLISSNFVALRHFSLSAEFAKKSEEANRKNEQPLSVFFEEAVELSKEKRGTNAVKSEGDGGSRNLVGRLMKLEEEVRSLNKERRINPPSNKGNSCEEIGARRSLSALFMEERKKMKEVKLVDAFDYGKEEASIHKVLSPDMQLFAHHLYLKGYLGGANFIRKNEYDPTVFKDIYARGVLKSAAVKFGEDHSEIAKWLSASDLKNVALFGCPSLARRSAYAAKYLRGFFQIEEHEVCQKCTLRKSCKHANEKPGKDPSKLNLATVTRVLVVYALELVPQQLVVPEEIRDSVCRLLKEIINLTQNGS